MLIEIEHTAPAYSSKARTASLLPSPRTNFQSISSPPSAYNLYSQDRNSKVKEFNYENTKKQLNSLYNKLSSAEAHKEAIEAQRKEKFRSQDEKRQRRTLRSKISKILSSLPELCQKQNKHDTWTKAVEKRQNLIKLNEIRSSRGLDPLEKLEISSDEEVDYNGNLYKKTDYFDRPVTLRNLLYENLTPKELAVMSEDPLYYIQNSKYLEDLNLLKEKSWDELIAEDPKDPNNIKKSKRNFTDKFLLRNCKSESQKLRLKDPEAILLTKRAQMNDSQNSRVEQAMESQKMMEQYFRDKQEQFKLKSHEKYQKIQNMIEENRISIRKRYETKQAKIEEKIHKEKARQAEQLQKKKQIYEKHVQKIIEMKKKKETALDTLRDFKEIFNEMENVYKIKLKEQQMSQKLVGVKDLIKKWEAKEYFLHKSRDFSTL
ncbi:unnamed protein product [Blepharisma stoltei]|uniref:Uncharacterized protein n=1 Tax=Blepharisma stoltei TaxID=1481888 RepID=A0AAU9IEK1_9CILI|nr:unnamed protein product [Blepharisma stoltei]